ncbi:MAG: hypothetical protein J6W87_02455 [Clostridia bacterium]|nr:hypothetical protein [Clostridia bacterium]
MDAAFNKLSEASQGVFAKIYQQQAPNGGQDPNAGGDTEFHQGGAQ